MNTRIRGTFINLALVLVSTIFSLLLLEILLRISITPEINKHDLFVEYDPLLGWKKISNYSGRYKTTEYSILETINSQGIRGPEYSFEKKEDEYRILILGDSFAEGYTVECQDLFSEVLKTELNTDSNHHHEVITMGTGGYSTDQELLVYRKEGFLYNPDLTILLFTDNDVWWNNQDTFFGDSNKPYFLINKSGELVLQNVPVPTNGNPDDNRPENEFNQFLLDPVDWAKSWASQRSYLYRFFRDRVENTPFLYNLFLRARIVKEESSSVDTQKTNTTVLPLPESYQVYKNESNEIVNSAWTITEALLLAFRKKARSIGSDFLIFYVPGHASVYPEDWDTMKKSYGISEEIWRIDRVALGLTVICNRHSFDCIDPSEIYKIVASKPEMKGQRLYFLIDRHWTVHGHKLAGEILADHIKNNYLSKDLSD